MEEGPYRSSGAIPCPKCSSALLDEGPTMPRRCSAGCGEWYSDAVFDDALVVLSITDPLRWKLPAAPRCPWCDDELRQLQLGDDVIFRCNEHGTWLDQGMHDRLRVRANEIRQFREERKLADLLSGENPSLAIARRFLALERRFEALEQELRRRG